MATHPQVEISVGQQSAFVDTGMAELIGEVWRAGCETKMSCQERPDGRAYITFPDAFDAQRFLAVAAGSFSEHPDSLYNRVMRVWHAVPRECADDPDALKRAAADFAWERFWTYYVEPWDENVRRAKSGRPLGRRSTGPAVMRFETTIAFPPSDIDKLLRRFRKANDPLQHGDYPGLPL